MFNFRCRLEEYCIAKSYWNSTGLWHESFWYFRHDSSELHEGCFLWKVEAEYLTQSWRWVMVSWVTTSRWVTWVMDQKVLTHDPSVFYRPALSPVVNYVVPLKTPLYHFCSKNPVLTSKSCPTVVLSITCLLSPKPPNVLSELALLIILTEIICLMLTMHAYCKNHCTETALLYIHNHLINAIDSQQTSLVYVFLIFLLRIDRGILLTLLGLVSKTNKTNSLL